MAMNQKELSRRVVVLGTLGLAACAGGGGGPDGGACSSGAHDTSISANHGHALSVPAADLEAGADQSYSIQGSAAHDHTITITAAQLTTLLAGDPVTVTSSSALGHTHEVTVTCQ